MLEKSHYNNKYPNTRKKSVVDYETIVELLEYNQTIPAQERDKAYIKETNSFYDWRVGDNSVADGVNIITQKSGKGRWVKIGNSNSNGEGKFHSHIVATTPYDPLNPLTGWIAPVGAIEGNTVEVKFTDGTVGNYTFDGTVWIQNYDNLNIIGEIVVVLDGQSNSIGQQASSTIPLKELNNLKVWNGTSWISPQLGAAPFNPNGADNMGLRFCEKLAAENPQHKIKFIQLGNNGEPLSYWTNTPYTGLFNVLNTLNAAGVTKVDVFVWDQGESDNLNNNYISQYYNNLMANLLSFPQIDNRTKFLNVGMFTGPSAVYPNRDLDFRLIGFDENEYTSYVNTYNLESYDNVHFTNQSMLMLGYDRIYNAFLNTPYTYKLESSPVNGLRVESGTIYRGSDVQTLPKGSQLIHTTYNHLNGFSDIWMSATENVFNIKNARDSENVITETAADIKVNDVYIGRGKGNVYGNTVVGLALRNNTTGLLNSSFGNSNLFSNTIGNYNSAFGGNCLPFNTSGSNNSAFGEQSLRSNTEGSYNTSGGQQSLYNNVIGNNNTAFGVAAGFSILGSGNVLLGFQSGKNEIGSNKLYIANTDTNTPLIGGDFSTQELKIGGVQQFSIQFPTSGVGVANGSMFYGTDGALYFKGGAGTVTLIAAN